MAETPNVGRDLKINAKNPRLIITFLKEEHPLRDSRNISYLEKKGGWVVFIGQMSTVSQSSKLEEFEYISITLV